MTIAVDLGRKAKNKHTKLYLTHSFVYFYTQAQAKLGHLRVEANRIKSGLERKIQVHKTAVKRAKTILKHMQVSTITGAINSVQGSHKLWKSWKTWKITQKSSMHGKIVEFEKT